MILWFKRVKQERRYSECFDTNLEGRMCNNNGHVRRVMVVDFSGEFTTKKQMDVISTFGEIHLITSGVAFINKLRTIFCCRTSCLNKCPLNIIVDEKERLNNDMTVIDYLVFMNIDAELFNFSFKKINQEEIYNNNIKGNKKIEYLVNSKKELRQKVEFKNKMKEFEMKEKQSKALEQKRKLTISNIEQVVLDQHIKNIIDVKKNRPIRKTLFNRLKEKYSNISFSQYRNLIKRASL